MVLAVPMTPHVPAVGANSSFNSEISSISISLPRYAAQLLRQSVHAPMRWPRKLPGIMGPVMSGRTGLPDERPPMICAGTVLSQPIYCIQYHDLLVNF